MYCPSDRPKIRVKTSQSSGGFGGGLPHRREVKQLQIPEPGTGLAPTNHVVWLCFHLALFSPSHISCG